MQTVTVFFVLALTLWAHETALLTYRTNLEMADLWSAFLERRMHQHCASM